MKNSKITKFLYLGFLLLGCFYLINKSIGEALINLGIALAFDPFNPSQAWNERPSWQKLALITHLSIVFGLVFIEIYDMIKR
jgi:hypothetical protein